MRRPSGERLCCTPVTSSHARRVVPVSVQASMPSSVISTRSARVAAGQARALPNGRASCGRRRRAPRRGTGRARMRRCQACPDGSRCAGVPHAPSGCPFRVIDITRKGDDCATRATRSLDRDPSTGFPEGDGMRQVRLERGQILPLVAVALVALLGIGAFCDRRRLRLLRQAPVAERDRCGRARRRAGPAEQRRRRSQRPAPMRSPIRRSTSERPPSRTRSKCTNASIISSACNSAVSPNSITVTGKAKTATWFAGIFGIKSFDVSAHANACSPCSATPVDIVVALDRTKLDVPRGQRRLRLRRSRQRQGRRAHAALDAQPAVRADRHGGLPAARDEDDGRVYRPAGSERQLHGLRQRHARLPHRSDREYLQDRRPVPAYDRRRHRVHPGRGVHVLQRGACGRRSSSSTCTGASTSPTSSCS